MCVFVCVVCVGPVGDGESAMGQGTVAGLEGDLGVWRGDMWKVTCCNGNRGPEAVPIGKKK